MVRLRPVPLGAIEVAGPGFNPTMVRLRPNLYLNVKVVTPQFQSHYGAIATRLFRNYGGGVILFQSHYGAIATQKGLTDDEIAQLGFNPTMVRLRLEEGRILHSSNLVSIPLWCDCDPYRQQ